MAICEYDTRKESSWYNAYIFPIVPIIEKRPGDNHNTPHFGFKWLFFTMWTIDAFCFEITIVCDTHWGIGIIGLMPYFRWSMTIPCTPKIGLFVQKNLWRSPSNELQNN